ncbi:MAG: hypothetical protein SGPRY_007889, partial [Prymnesium sp.]
SKERRSCPPSLPPPLPNCVMTGLRAVQAAKLHPHGLPSTLSSSQRDERIEELMRSLALQSTAPHPQPTSPPPDDTRTVPTGGATPAEGVEEGSPLKSRRDSWARLSQSDKLESSLDLFLYAESVATSHKDASELSSLVARADSKRLARKGSAPARSRIACVEEGDERTPNPSHVQPQSRAYDPPPPSRPLPASASRPSALPAPSRPLPCAPLPSTPSHCDSSARLSSEEGKLRASLARLDEELHARRLSSAAPSRRHGAGSAPSTIGMAARLRMATAAAACAENDAVPCRMHGLLRCKLCAQMASNPRRNKPPPPPPPPAKEEGGEKPRRTKSAGSSRTYLQLGSISHRPEARRNRVPPLPPRQPVTANLVPVPQVVMPEGEMEAGPHEAGQVPIAQFVDDYYVQLCSEWGSQMNVPMVSNGAPAGQSCAPPQSSCEAMHVASNQIARAPNAHALLFG